MVARKDPTLAVLAFLEASQSEVTAQDVRKATNLPLAAVTRILQTRANELVPDVERIDQGDQVVYRYIGTGAKAESVEEPPASMAAHAEAQASEVPRAQSPASEASAQRNDAKSAAPKPQDRREVAPPVSLTRETYERIGEILKVPMNLNRLARETQLAPEQLRPALTILVDAGLITEREMMEDIVYRPVGDLSVKMAEVSLPTGVPAFEPEGAASVVELLDEAALVQARMLSERVEERLEATDALVDEANGLAEQVRRLVDETRFWRQTAETYSQLMNQVLAQQPARS